MSSAKGIREVAYVDTRQGGGVRNAHAVRPGFEPLAWHDCAGGGQIVVEKGIAYVGNMRNPHGTMVIDVSDPRHPKPLAAIAMPIGTHSHKVRVANGLMLTNREVLGERAARGETPPEDFQGGLGIYDVSNPAKPKLITNWKTTDKPGPSYARGVHRFDFDGRYAYISPTWEGYLGNIVMILDLADPARPVEVGRWWMPGQWLAGGETPSWRGRQHRCHHPIRLGDRLYVSYWHGGFVILDIADLARPRFVSGLDWSPPFMTPTHTALPVPFPLHGRRVLLVSDEDVAKLEPGPPSFLWLVDVTDERRPVPFASFQVAGVDGSPQPEYTGCHQPCEEITGTEIPVAWFAHGLRIVDIADLHAPRESAHFVPDVPPGQARVCSNDVCVDDRGLLYLIDRGRGLHILERV